MRGWLVAIGIVALIVLGFVFIKPPTPTIVLAPEHIFDIGPLEVTNTMFTSWVVVVLMVGAAVLAGRSMSLVPSGVSGAIEAFVGGFYAFIENIVGEVNARRFFPVVTTIFLYVLFANYVGLLPINFAVGRTEPGAGETQAVFQQTSIAGIDLAFIPLKSEEVDTEEQEPLVPGEEEEHGSFSGLLAPYFRSVMTDVNAPAALAIMSFVFVEYWAFSTLGFGYLKKFFAFGNLLRGRPMGIIDVFVGLLELVSELIRMVSFTFRLFGNVFAGEVLLLMMSFLVPLVLVDVFYGLELFVGLIQAFVFAMLTLVFAQTAVASHGGEHEEYSAAHE
ncbi:MAG: F0F1 ATP synthase subunit A [Chloroflexi bacterium]|nr:F0F1 ATP synthase subunit A [Chloroflexota bacterium]